MAFDPQSTLKTFRIDHKREGRLYSLPELGRQLGIDLSRMPLTLRIVLESVLRNCDGVRVTPEHVMQLANWQPNAPRTEEVPLVVARVVLQDFTGVPLLADLASMRNVAQQLGRDPKKIEPLVPVDLVVDHSVQIDHYGNKHALDLNMQIEFKRNRERYQFLKWGMQGFDTFGVVPPGFGIVHQVNLEYLARGVWHNEQNVYYADTLVGTDSHTTMINGIGVVGWGVGGIEAEAGMLGQPVYFLMPDVVGVELKGQLREGVLSTDLVLTITEMLRRARVVGAFVEFFGEGVSTLTVQDRATISNMAPEYGATMGFFSIDERTLAFFHDTGRDQDDINAFESWFKAQELFGVPKTGEIDYTTILSLDLSLVAPSLAGPKRPQDRIEIGHVKATFTELFSQPIADNGFAKSSAELDASYRSKTGIALRNGDVLIAAITSCTNTSNPTVLLAAGLLAKKAVEAGLKVAPHIKTSLAPGSRIVTDYLRETGLQPYLDKLGFTLAAYGCATCIGNSGDLAADLNETIIEHDLVVAAVLSGNRNFEARIHPNIRANFLASPPLVVAYALAGTMLRDLMTEPVGIAKNGREVWLGDIWPRSEEIGKLLKYAMDRKKFRTNYAEIKTKPGKLWEQIPESTTGVVYDWPPSTYIAMPPFFDDFKMIPDMALKPIRGARVLAIFGDSVTTDHISPAGPISRDSPAGLWLLQHGVAPPDFNSYGSRRGNHEVMMRGTFANVRIKNLMLPPREDGSREEGGITLFQPGSEKLSIYDAAMRYSAQGTPTVVFAGEEYGTGSSRDWAAKGPHLLGVKAVIARSFERIHRANLVGMGVLPLQLLSSDSVHSLGIDGSEAIDIVGPGLSDTAEIQPQQQVTMRIHRSDGSEREVKLLLRIDTPIEVQYYRHGGILPYVLRNLLSD